MAAYNLGEYLSSLKDVCFENKTVSTVAILSGVGATVYLLKKIRGKRKRVCGVDYPKDTVILHVGNFTGKYIPSFGHFCMKLQTYLNVTKIPYQVCHDTIPAPKGKIPWIEYNGMAMGDSQLIINYLNKEFNVDLNKSLTKEKRAQAWAIQKWLEEFTYWLNVYTRWYILLDDHIAADYIDPSLNWHMRMTSLFRKKNKERLRVIGIGRHTDQEVHEMMAFDLRQLSVLLGDKQYLMGGDSPTELDCAAFGQLAQVRWATPDSCPGKKILTGELTNLMAYLDRIKTTYWPDWDSYLCKMD